MLNRCFIKPSLLILVSLAFFGYSSVALAVVKDQQKSKANSAVSQKILDKKHPDYIRAVLLAKITSYVYWQANSFTSIKSPFNLCIIESEKQSIKPIWPYLNLLSGRKSAGRSFQLVEVSEYQTTPKQLPQDCHIYYFASLNQQNTQQLVSVANSLPVLTIGDSMEELYNGAMLAFIEERGRMKIYVNTEALSNSSLKIKSSLLRIAKKI